MRVRECEEVSEGEETTCADGRLQVYFSVDFGPWRFFGDALPEQGGVIAIREGVVGGVHLRLTSSVEDGGEFEITVV